MQDNTIPQGVRPGGLVNGTEIRILLCYLLYNTKTPITRMQMESVLLGSAYVNYFALADSLAQICAQQLAEETPAGFIITPAGETVAKTLADTLPRTIREDAANGVILAQQYATRAAAHQCEITKTENGNTVTCTIKDESGSLFSMQMYMPDNLTAAAVKENFIGNADLVYKLVLSALTSNKKLAEETLKDFKTKE